MPLRVSTLRAAGINATPSINPEPKTTSQANFIQVNPTSNCPTGFSGKMIDYYP
jgi:hypothetical protein